MSLSWPHSRNLATRRESSGLLHIFRPSPEKRWPLRLLPSIGLLTLLCAILIPEVRAQQSQPTIVIVSGNGQTGIVNTPLPNPFVVRVEINGEPVDKFLVTWQVVAGGGTLSAGNTTFTDFNGLASNTLTPSSSPGAITVSAAPFSGAAVFFDVNNPTPDAAIAGLRQFSQLANLALTTATVQTTNIGLRLSALRRGARGISLGGPSIQGEGQPVPLTVLAGLLSAVDAGGGAGAEQPSVFRRLGIFLNGQGSFGDQTATTKEPGFKFHTTGATLGGDYRFTDRFVLGTAFGYVSTEADFDASAGDFSARGFSASVFGSYYVGEKFYLDTIATYGWNDFDTRRSIAPAAVETVAKGDTDGTQFALSVSGGYNFAIGGLAFGPTVRVNYIRVDIDGFREKDGGIFDLNVGRQEVRSVTTGVGGQISYAISMPWGVLVPSIRGEWEHEFKGNSRLLTGTLVADPLQTTFAVETNDPDRDYATAGASVTATFTSGMATFVSYEAVVGRENFTHHALNAGIRLEF